MHIPFFVTNFGRLILSLALLAAGVGSFLPAQAQGQDTVDIRQFDRMTASSGWILLDQTLFWTLDAGLNWENITPTMPAGAVVQDVRFIDPAAGWLLFTTPDPVGGALFHLASTMDGGAAWSVRALSLFEPGEIASYAETIQMDWFDAQTGWLAVKQVSGSNFSLGTLFITSDGGGTWQRSALPIAGKVYFSDPLHGWVTGGAAGDQVFVTADAGATWQDASPEEAENARAQVYAPFVADGAGLLVRVDVGAANNLNVYRLDNPSGVWTLFDQVPLPTQPGLIGLSVLDEQNFTATLPGTASIVRMVNGQIETIRNRDGLSASIVALDMISLEEGWANSVVSNCATESSPNETSASVLCSTTTRLLHTQDGGATWQSLLLPTDATGTARASAFRSTSRSTTMNTLSSLGNTQIYIGQGFDICEIPTLSQMQTWATNSPYKVVNLYIGGSSRLCSNAALTSAYLKQLSAQGWKFIPTWVGPQAPCTGFNTRMSSNAATAYNQGIAQANLAVETLANLGLTLPDKTGSVVYYDIEYYGSDSACRTAVSSFMNGWVSQLHVRENLAGVYASPACNTGLNDFRGIANVPDVVWIAAWYYNIGDPRGAYDPTASVWDWLGSCLPASAWSNHQRIRQYSGDHTETWGSLSLEIDNDILDGVVAIPYVPMPPPYVLPTAMPTRPRPVMRSQALPPASLDTQLGMTGGSLSSLSLLDQTGAEDNPAAYLSFQTPDTVYTGYQSFFLPEDARTRTISAALLQVHFKGDASTIWSWAIYDWNSDLWIKLGDSTGTEADQWQNLIFRIRQPWRVVSSQSEIRIQLRSNNANGDAKVDYEAIHITYLSNPALPTPYAPPITPVRPRISSIPITTPSP